MFFFADIIKIITMFIKQKFQEKLKELESQEKLKELEIMYQNAVYICIT